MTFELKILRKVCGLLIGTFIHCNGLNKSAKFIFCLRWSIRFIFFDSRVNLNNSDEISKKRAITLYQPIGRNDLQNGFLDSSLALPCSVNIPIERVLSFSLLKMLLLVRVVFLHQFQFKKILIGITLLELNKIYKEILKYSQLKNKKFFFYNEKQYWEGLWCIALEKNMFSTASFTHGFYRDTGRICSITNTNPWNYLYQISKTQICWGEIQKNIMSKYNTSKTEYIVLGKRDLMVRAANQSLNNKRSLNVLMLDSQQLSVSNREAVKALRDKEANFLIKRHPDDQADYGLTVINNLEEILDDVEAFWGINSSAILQIGRAGYQVYLHEKSDFLNYIDPSYYTKNGEFFKIHNSYDWVPFIKLTGKDYLEALNQRCL